jgi:allantoin racemase
MEILLTNPNMTTAMTDRMTALARSVLPAKVTVLPMTAPRGFPYISSIAEAQIAGAICLEMLASVPPPDAAIIAAFGDPGLAAARDLFTFPVIGMAEAAILTAAQVGERFAIVTFTPAMRHWYSASVASVGMTHRFLGVRTPVVQPVNVGDVAQKQRNLLRDLATQAAEDGADVVILGGAPLAGLAGELADEIPAVLIDPILAAARQAFALGGLGLDAHRRLARPMAKPSSGLSEPLAKLIARDGEAK